MKQLLIVFLGLFLFSACDSTDVRVLQRPGQEDRTDTEAYCYVDGNEVIVRVENSGTTALTDVEVLIDFPSFTSHTKTTGPMTAGQIVEVRAPIPSGCYNSDCNYRITLDPNNLIQENNENNNVQEAICIG